MEIGILGGTGPAGRALAARLALAGYQVVIGSRAIEKATEVTEGINSKWGELFKGAESRLLAAENARACQTDIVVIATPPEAAVATVKGLSSELADSELVISMCNAMGKTKEGSFYPKVDGSIAEAIAAELPAAEVVATFHHLPAKTFADLSGPIENDVLVCANSKEAFNATAAMIKSIKNLRPLYAGPLENAISLEALTPTLINLSKNYKAQASIKITGL